MTGIALGAGAGAVLAFAALAFGFWGFLLMALFVAVGGVVGAAVTGRLDIRAMLEAGRGRRAG
ncbi:hypothetical protein [Pseudolysinimonas sp.]|uniref:hypothetical protein n=1 Tax=Pseudolysinimonas sp. TaxID=2680009 RepID=UPI003F8161F9